MSECFAMLKFIWLPYAQTAATKRLTRFIWKKIIICFSLVKYFLKINEPLLRNVTNRASMLYGSCWWYMIRRSLLDNGNNNEIIFIAKWHTNHVQKLMIKTKQVIGLSYMKYRTWQSSREAIMAFVPQYQLYQRDCFFWSAEQKQWRVLELLIQCSSFHALCVPQEGHMHIHIHVYTSTNLTLITTDAVMH